MPTGLVTVSQYTAEPPVQIDLNSTFEVRGFYTRDFIAGDGVTPIYGNATSGNEGPYYDVDCTLNASGNLVVPAHEIQATTLSNPTAMYFEGLWVDGAFVRWLMPNTQSATGWAIPTVYGTPLAIDEIALYNRAKRLLYPPDTYPTFDEVVLLIQRLAGNFDYMAVDVNGIGSASFPPVVASEPIVLMENDPKVGSWFNILSYFADTSNTPAQNAVAIFNAVTAAANAGGGIYIPVGSFATNSVNITVPLMFAPGESVLSIEVGQQVGITRSITADLSTHFEGLGTISLLTNPVVDIVYPQWWGGFAGNESINSAEAIQKAIDVIGSTTGGRGGWVQLTDIYGIQETLAIPNNVGLMGAGGQNSRRGGLSAIAPFTGDFMIYVSNDTPTPNSSAFDNFLSGVNINAKNIAGLGAVKNKTWQENSGTRNCVIQGFTTYGIYYEGGGGGAATSIIEETEIFAGAAGATAGIEISLGVSTGLIVMMLGGGVSGVFADAAIHLTKASLNCLQVHFEESNTGILLDGVGNSVLTSVSGGASRAISAASNTNPVSFTQVGHGLVTGNVISIYGGTSAWAAVNGNWAVTVTSPTTFTIPVNSSGFGAVSGLRTGMESVIRIAENFTGSVDMFGCQRNGTNYLLKDDRLPAAGVIPFDPPITTDDPTVTIASIGASFRANGSNRFLGDISLVGENANNMVLYKTTNTSTNSILLTDSLPSANRESLIISIDPDNTLGFGIGAFLAVGANGSGTTQDLNIYNFDAKSIKFSTSALERARITPSGALAQIEGAVLSINGSGVTAPTHNIHHLGAGLLKTITLPSGFASGTIYIIPDAAFTYDATGNIVVPIGGGTAVVGRVMAFTYSSSSSKFYPSY